MTQHPIKTSVKNYFIYVRKSSESEDRQVLSIESQKKELKDLANRLSLRVTQVFDEAQSAKAPGRPIFSHMMERLYKGEVDGVLCWKLDRLARNPVDGGSVIWAVKNNQVEIVTPSQTYSHQSENTLLMYVEFGMAQKFIDDLGKNALRGMKTKAEQGWYPAPAPLGYLNTPSRQKGFKIIKKDPKRFKLIRQLFDLLLIEKKTAVEAWRIAVNQWKLTTRRGDLIARSTVYRLLTNPFYYGEFEWPSGSGNWYQGKHRPLITKTEYDQIQVILGNKGAPRPKTHHFTYTGTFKCGECGYSITATIKVKYYKKTNRLCTYIYYHCSKKHPHHKCSQKPVTENELERQISQLLKKISIHQDFIEWAIKWLRVLHKYETNDRSNIYKSLQRRYNSTQDKLDKLLDMSLDGRISDQEYGQKKNQLFQEQKSIKEQLEDTEHRAKCWHQTAEETFDFAKKAYQQFKNGSLETKKKLLIYLGSNFYLENGKIRIQLKKPLEILENYDQMVKKESAWVEPQQWSDILAKNEDLRPANLVWLRGRESNA
jgi:site-specific DNA recombinase